jgi:hypothetical protein
MNEKKIETIISLVGDAEVMKLTEEIVYNWDVAVNRILQIEKEREEGLSYDGDVEAMSVFCRMEQVNASFFSLLDHPQAVLLHSIAERLRPLADDQRMDREVAQMTIPEDSSTMILPYTFWERLQSVKQNDDLHVESSRIVTDMYVKNILPHLSIEHQMDTMQALISNEEQSEEKQEQIEEARNELQQLGKNIRIIARGCRQLMGMGLMGTHLWVSAVCSELDMMQMEAATVGRFFEKAKKDLMESEEWQSYWKEHRRHLAMQGDLETELAKDAEEVEQWLMDAHDYLYNKWNEGTEAFGEALQQAALNDRDMLLLLFYLTKKDAIAMGNETTAERRTKMEQNVVDAAIRLHELADDAYYERYEQLWQQLVKGEALSRMLMDYNSSKYNKGFSMLCLCKIIGHLHREYHLFGHHTPEELGKALGDKYSRETFSNYIKKKKTELNDQCFKEIAEALETIRK